MLVSASSAACLWYRSVFCARGTRVATGDLDLMPLLLAFCAKRFSRLGDSFKVTSITEWVVGGVLLLFEERSKKEWYG